jgi:hypothetical protein
LAKENKADSPVDVKVQDETSFCILELFAWRALSVFFGFAPVLVALVMVVRWEQKLRCRRGAIGCLEAFLESHK